MVHNSILHALNLPPNEVARRFKYVHFLGRQVVSATGEMVKNVFFPHIGMMSAAVEMIDGRCMGTAMIGHNGVVGGAALFGGTQHFSSTIAALPSSGWLIAASDLIELCKYNTAFCDLVYKHELFLLCQAQRRMACIGSHHLAERLAGWLLQAQDVSGEAILHITQGHLAELVGVKRPSLSITAKILQNAGAIGCRRGRIHIVDRPKLEDAACDCHRTLREQHARIFREHRTAMGASELGVASSAIRH